MSSPQVEEPRRPAELGRVGLSFSDRRFLGDLRGNLGLLFHIWSEGPAPLTPTVYQAGTMAWPR